MLSSFPASIKSFEPENLSVGFRRTKDFLNRRRQFVGVAQEEAHLPDLRVGQFFSNEGMALNRMPFFTTQ